MNNFSAHTDRLVDMILSYLPRLALALATLVIGLWVIRVLVNGLMRLIASRKIDESLKPFFRSVTSVVLKVLLLISVMGMIGIEMTSFIALLGAAGVSIGIALSGSLQHFAGGVLILIYKPFKKGDFIEAQGQKGSVMEIRIFNTVLNTLDNKVVFIPNGPLSTGTIINYSAEETRRIDMIFPIGYSDDIDKVKGIIHRLIDSDTRILKEPASVVGVSELTNTSVNLAVRVWVKTSDFNDVNFDILERVKKEFDKEGITIPLPQMHVQMKKEE
jgi:small conductance mechanosensitive channel